MSVTPEHLAPYLAQEPGVYYGWDPVNEAMIRHWCDAMGDRNPVYTDADAAAASVHGGIIAPPAMMQAWIMRGYGGEWGPGSDEREPFAMLDELAKLGYPAVVAVNCEQEYHQYLRPGDRVYYRSRIESISEEKTTALGAGFFITELGEYFRKPAGSDSQDGELIGTMRFRVFRYRPHPKEAAPAGAAADTASAPAAPARMRPVRNYDNAFFWEGVDRGELLIQRCGSCQTLRHPPSPMCPHCQSLERETVKASGRGVIHSFVKMHHPAIPPFDYPNPVILVELEEGTRLVSQLDGSGSATGSARIEIGMPVQVVFREVEEGFVLPLFRPAEEA